MPDQPVSDQKAQHITRFNYAVETVVDRSVREQDRFLGHCQSKRIELTLFSITGASFLGIVHGYDRDTILFGGSGKSATPRLFLKTFVALIIPRTNIELFLEYRGLGTARRKNRRERFIATMLERGDGEQLVELAQLSATQKRFAAGSGKKKRKPGK
ncbi:RNA chaperone Hfq [Pseudomonas syringae]|uniref:RNA chaperone Hfq n=1 Tax=Pseudomonas syringae TaxID=317 RepID=UPI001F34A263|nr:RNA chaperone Hfq [Pseudomonas syringae]MCF5371239.1 hypothetical protein [Pseudomonas syringae]